MAEIYKCPKCGSEQIFVIDSRKRHGSIWRRKKCGVCGERFSTYEVSDKDFESYQSFYSKVSGIEILLDEIKRNLPKR